MNQHVKQLIADARKLSPEEQAELLDALLVGFHEPSMAWNEAWGAEADRRWARYLAGDETSHDADSAIVDAKKRLAKRRAR